MKAQSSQFFGRCVKAVAVLAIGSAPMSARLVEAAGLPDVVTMKQLVLIIREKSPRFAALQQRVEGARAEVVASEVLPNPRISYGRYDLTSTRNTMYDGNVQQEVMLEWPVLVAGQRPARVEAAQKRAEATQADVEAEFAILVQEVWKIFVKLLADQQRVTILRQTASDLQHLAATVAGRERAGSASRYDVLRIDIEAKAVQTRQDAARNEVAFSAGELGVLLGLPGWKPEAAGELKPLGIPFDAVKAWRDAERLNPELEAARRSEIAAGAGMERASRERWPVPSILVGSAFTEKPFGNAAFAGVSVELPLFDRGQGGMARAAAESRAASLEQQFIAAKTRVALERGIDLLARRHATRVEFERDVLEKLPDLKAMGESAYRLGKGTLLELLDASRSRTDIRLTHLDLVQAEVEAELEVLKASGTLVGSAANGSEAMAPGRREPEAQNKK